ncbi:putative Cobyrinic acid A,C-diamide synthase [Nitrospina gracilis 3/211]|uniref:Cobyrinate a,c-diamide synthase n=1 Tax=Nitrospina gracilis (strain 3/211) TaxID=1266370 RepID=M1YIU6_NITG3|nr:MULTISPECIES: cobyrinate a,c-diamide synthase [Nitrospina]MCF8723363.1 cobyrinic acid a,c-diamide synthase [Nitrospina sp. Nb-3]CCQ90418.1 putative Cobyrinic acid A,C-diamide synthase [Nitrospina gracilis 3/211]
MSIQNHNARGLLIAGTHTSVGKSSIAIGLMRCFRNRGFNVKPFKVGPDYIDPGHHALASGNPSYNLDSWMGGAEYVRNLFEDIVEPGDRFVVEGVMGLHDGAHATKAAGSTAEVAHLLDVPVVLVIDGSMLARSAAALVKGYMEFDERVNVFGMIANRVNSPGHAKILKDAIEHATPARFLGTLPTKEELKMPSRHLGLHLAQEQDSDIYEQWATHLEEHLDIAAFMDALPDRNCVHASRAKARRFPQVSSTKPFSVAIAKDAALHFIYQDTLDLIGHYGGTIHYFSPLDSPALPSGVDWVYLPGGYPELHAERLSANTGFLSSLREFVNGGGPVVGECGGLMLLGKVIVDVNKTSHTMTGVFDFTTSFQGNKRIIGYRNLEYSPEETPESVIELRGHEFHFSLFEDNNEKALMIHRHPETGQEIHDGYRKKNAFALYSHIHWRSSLRWWDYLLHHCILPFKNSRRPVS